jgi:nitrate/nitrite-specific signal transduction histidine kinase
MSGQGMDDALEGADARDEAAHRDDRLAELERSHQRLQHLYDISRLLARFQTFRQILPKVVDLVAHTLPLRNAIVVLDTGGSAQAIIWQALGETQLRLRVAKTHAQATYRDLVRSNVDLEHEEVTTLEGLQLLPGPTATVRSSVPCRSKAWRS